VVAAAFACNLAKGVGSGAPAVCAAGVGAPPNAAARGPAPAATTAAQPDARGHASESRLMLALL
jgi:hypothetical protein